MRPLEQMLPELYRSTPQDRELQRVLMELVAGAERDKDFTLKQLFPSTASGWGMELWERAWGIPVDRTQSDQRRRERILAKVKGTGTTTVEVIRGIAESFSDCPVEVVELSELYRFVIRYIGTASIRHSEDLIAAVNQLKPAHLDFHMAFRVVTRSPVYGGFVVRTGQVEITQNIQTSKQGLMPAKVGMWERHGGTVISTVVCSPFLQNPIYTGLLTRQADKEVS